MVRVASLDRHPHQADVVGDQREVHREQQHLVHGVVEAEVNRGEATSLQLMGDVACAEDTRGESDEIVEDDEDDVEIVDQEVRGRVPASR